MSFIKMRVFIICLVSMFCIANIVTAQQNIPPVRSTKKDRYKIAVLAPLYLDSFNMKAKLLNLPKYAMQGIDFYQGAMIAADTLDGLGNKFDLYIHDSKSGYTSLKSLIDSKQLDEMDAIIGNIGGDDLKAVADFASSKRINFISAVSPSDAKQENNPFFTMLQPRLKTHVEKIHKHINYKYGNDNVVIVSRNVQNEINAKDYYINDKNNVAYGKSAELILNSDIINIDELKKKLEPGNSNTIVLCIMDPLVATENLKKLATISVEYKLKVYGMPTWENMTTLKTNGSFPNMQVYYTTPFILEKVTVPATYISNAYTTRMGKGVATDMVYKGFESLYFAGQLLKKYGAPINENQKENSLTFLTPFRIVPVFDNTVFKYYENTFLYVVKCENGMVSYE